MQEQQFQRAIPPDGEIAMGESAVSPQPGTICLQATRNFEHLGLHTQSTGVFMDYLHTHRMR